MKIWCLFSIANNYDQPDNNLVVWWVNKPNFKTLTLALGRIDTADKDIGQILRGNEMSLDGYLYRLKEVEEGLTL